MKDAIEAAIGAVVGVSHWDYWDGELAPDNAVVGRVILSAANRTKGTTTITHKVALGFNAATLKELYSQLYTATQALLASFATINGVCVGGGTLEITDVYVGEPTGYQVEDTLPGQTWVKTWLAFETKSTL